MELNHPLVKFILYLHTKVLSVYRRYLRWSKHVPVEDMLSYSQTSQDLLKTWGSTLKARFIAVDNYHYWKLISVEDIEAATYRVALAKSKIDSFECTVNFRKSTATAKTQLSAAEQHAILAQCYAEAKNELVALVAQYDVILKKHSVRVGDAEQAVAQATYEYNVHHNGYKTYYENLQNSSFDPRNFLEEFFFLGSTLVLVVGVFYLIRHFFKKSILFWWVKFYKFM